ncbi:MAG: gamma-glutamyltransferase [Hyphomicrobiaceae bacterium]|nr:gamma-glutamyltransferase [Hyphomicrobiaceae bacterium]
MTAEAAVEILRAGGTAVDAAIAAAFMACVCEPVLTSPGGGGFALLKPETGVPELVDFFAQTPLRPNPNASGFDEVFADFGTTTQRFHIGPASAATPGFVPGILHLHARAATLPLEELAAPAIAAARDGFKVTAFQAHLAAVVAPILSATSAARNLFAPDGRLHAEGSHWSNRGMASFFEALCRSPQSFARQELVAAMLDTQHDSHLGSADFEQYRVESRTPLALDLGSARVFTNPAPAAGGILVARTLMGLAGDTPLHHAEALDETDHARRDAGGDLAQLLETLGPPQTRGTTHISVADAAGRAVAMTLTNGEGNGEIVGDFGFMLNNMLGEEDVNPKGASGWPLGVRLSSMMAPTIATGRHGELLVLGSGGSSRIRSTIAQVMAHAILANKPIDQSVFQPRLHVEGDHLDIEAGFSHADEEALRNRFPNHRVWPGTSMYFGGCHAVARSSDGQFSAVGDPRRGGVGIVV